MEELSQEVERSMLDSTRLSKIEKSRLIRNIMSLFNERLFERALPMSKSLLSSSVITTLRTLVLSITQVFLIFPQEMKRRK